MIIIIGMFGICLLLWWFLQFIWGKVIPALIFILPVLYTLGFVLDHPFWTLLIAIVAFLAWGAYLNYRKEHQSNKMQEQTIKDQEKAEQDAEVKRVLDAADKALHDN